MNKKEQQLFISFFEEIYESEQAFQQIKKKISKCPKSNLSHLFNLISLDQEQIQIARLREYLTDKLTCNERELYEIFQKVDLSRQGFVSRDDFCRELTPLDQHIQNDKSNGEVSTEAEAYFLELIMEYIKRFRILEVARKQIQFILPYNAFAEIDNYKTGLIGLGELERFFNNNDFNITEYQLILLIHGLRRRCYLEVNLEVFCQNLSPLEFGQYDAYRANIEKDKSEDVLRRSRKEEDNMRRSRIESKKLQHSIAKQERRRRADLERQLQLQNRINSQIQEQERKKQLLLRKAALEEDKDIRWNLESAHNILQQERQRLLSERLRHEDLLVLKNQEELNDTLARTALLRENDLDHSRRLRHQIQREREISLNLQLERQSRRRESQYEQERLLRDQIERERQIRMRQLRARNQTFEPLQKQREARRRYWMAEIENNRRIQDEHLRLQSRRAQRQQEYQKIRNAQLSHHRPIDYPAVSRNISNLERELQKTRLEMRDRQTRLNFTDSKRQPETAERSHFERT